MTRRLDLAAPEPISPDESHSGGGGETKMPFPLADESLKISGMERRILVAVVDDEESICRALLRLLRASGMDVETFSSSTTFLDSMRERPRSRRPDCVVLDLHLPGLTGIDVQRQLKDAKISLPIVIITGNEEAGVQEKVLSEGASAFLVKPIHAQTLLTAIESAVQKTEATS
jgi:FixJ family two-component response regulator